MFYIIMFMVGLLKIGRWDYSTFGGEAKWSSFVKFSFEKINLRYKVDADKCKCTKIF